MFLHVGSSYSVCLQDILAIFDGESLRGKRTTHDLMNRLQNEGRLIDATKKEVSGVSQAVSYVFVHDKQAGIAVYCSPISSQTLLHRINATVQF